MPQSKSQTGYQNKWAILSLRLSSSKIKLEIFQGKLMKKRLKLAQSLLLRGLDWQSPVLGKVLLVIRIIGERQ